MKLMVEEKIMHIDTQFDVACGATTLHLVAMHGTQQ